MESVTGATSNTHSYKTSAEISQTGIVQKDIMQSVTNVPIPEQISSKNIRLEHDDSELSSVKSIGIFRSAACLKFITPSQPERHSSERNYIEIFSPYVRGLTDLGGFTHIWIVSWFHKSSNWRPMILPPRGAAQRRGVFSTRSPHRPNPIGITALRLYEIKTNVLVVGASDLIEGTPILDIKPYLSYADSFPESSLGWIEGVEAAMKERPSYNLSYSSLAVEQLEWLNDVHQINFMVRASKILERDPTPHRTRRIFKYNDNLLRISCGPWRVIYSLTDSEICINTIVAAYPPKVFERESYAKIADRKAQFEFQLRWPAE